MGFSQNPSENWWRVWPNGIIFHLSLDFPESYEVYLLGAQVVWGRYNLTKHGKTDGLMDVSHRSNHIEARPVLPVLAIAGKCSTDMYWQGKETCRAPNSTSFGGFLSLNFLIHGYYESWVWCWCPNPIVSWKSWTRLDKHIQQTSLGHVSRPAAWYLRRLMRVLQPLKTPDSWPLLILQMVRFYKFTRASTELSNFFLA